MLDPFLDQQRAYRFSVNGYGVQSDAIINAGGSTRGHLAAVEIAPGTRCLIRPAS